MEPSELRTWLRTTDPQRLEDLWSEADAVRRAGVGDAVHLRGLVEISSHCTRRCAYCGLRAPNTGIQRYRMTADEIVDTARLACELGYGTVVLQSGEDPALTEEWVFDLVRRIKAETPLAITLSLGERTPDELAAWRLAGADRYLLRFETSNGELFRRIHPSKPGLDRRVLLGALRELGYEVGSGVMIGIPGQTYEDLAADIELFRTLDLDMIGVGPFLPHPDTPLGRGVGTTRAAGAAVPGRPAEDQVPNSELMTYKVVALTRLVCPRTNIPSTTALATVNQQDGRENGLRRGANVIMPNLTPPAYRCCYEIYPGKVCAFEGIREYDTLVRRHIAELGREVGTGRGDSPNRRARREGVRYIHSGECI